MNSKIKKLAEQVETKEVGYCFFDREKFAELIIKECAAVADFYSDGHMKGQFGRVTYHYRKDISKELLNYFGVE